ncbi:MAG: hypothetical protein KA369_16350 [Spirochaetes bacterium]|nr:hypothetical protein [Spirochaetota bacterium]
MNKMLLITACVVLSLSCCGMRISHDNEVHVTAKPLQIDQAEYGAIRNTFNLYQVMPVNDLAGSLTPAYPMAMGKERIKRTDCLFYRGCTAPEGFTLIIKTGDGYRIARNQDDLKKFFAPIETREEALSYAFISTGLKPEYKFDLGKKPRTFVWKINSTYSIEKGNGYEVNLFDYRECGCGPHPYTMNIYRVGRNGDLIKIETVKYYEDPDQDGLCVD